MNKKQREREGPSAAAADTQPAVDNEPRAVLVGVWADVGKGWRMVRVELPQSLVERYAVDITEPELRGITLAKAVHALEKGGER